MNDSYECSAYFWPKVGQARLSLKTQSHFSEISVGYFPWDVALFFRSRERGQNSAFMSYSNLVAAKRARDSDSQIILRA